MLAIRCVPLQLIDCRSWSQWGAAPATSPTQEATEASPKAAKTEKLFSSLEELKEDVAVKIDALKPTAEVIKEAYELCEPFLKNVEILESIIKGIGEVRRPPICL